MYDLFFVIYDVKSQIILYGCEPDSPRFQDRIISKLKLLRKIGESIDLCFDLIQQGVISDGILEREFNVIRRLRNILLRRPGNVDVVAHLCLFARMSAMASGKGRVFPSRTSCSPS